MERRPGESVESWQSRIWQAQREEIERNNRTAPPYGLCLVASPEQHMDW